MKNNFIFYNNKKKNKSTNIKVLINPSIVYCIVERDLIWIDLIFLIK